MLINLFWLCLGSGLTLLSNLALSHKMSIKDFGMVTGLFALANLLAVLCVRGQQGIILSRSPGIHSNTLHHAAIRIAPILVTVTSGISLYYLFTRDSQSLSLVILFPFIILSITCQVMMGTAQAKAEINKIGFYQCLPSLGRSIPAFLWAAVAAYTNNKANAQVYFNYTSVFCFIAVIFVFISLIYQPTCKETTVAPLKSCRKIENAFWLSSVLSSSYASLMAPLLLFTWGNAAAGAFGVYLMLWGVANIVISSTFNNFLLPKYAAIRLDDSKKKAFLKRNFSFALTTALVIGVTGIILIKLCLEFIWPSEYQEYTLFFYICLISLIVRPFSASIGLPLNFSEHVRKKTKIQTFSVIFLAIAIIALSSTSDYILLSLAIVIAEIIVITCYHLTAKRT